MIVRPCIEDGHTVWQNDSREGYPRGAGQGLLFRANASSRRGSARNNPDRSGSMAKLSSVADCQAAALSKMGSFRDVTRLVKSQPQGVSKSVGESLLNAARSVSSGAQIAPFAFESCLALTTIEFVMSSDDRSRALPDGSFCRAGIESLRLPPDFNFIGPMACENCKQLVEVDLMCPDITAIWAAPPFHIV